MDPTMCMINIWNYATSTLHQHEIVLAIVIASAHSMVIICWHYLLSYSMEQSPWEANWFSAS